MIVAPEPPAVLQEDPRSLYRSAVTDRLAGRPEQAAPKLEQVLRATPDDVDARLNLGLALLALDRLEEAEAAFRQVIARAPDYADAWIGLARIAQRRGDLAEARTLIGEVRRADPENAEAVALENALEPAPPWRMDIAAARSRLSNNLPDWTETRLSASRWLDAAWTVGGAAEITRRFNDTDVYVEARADRMFEGGSAYLAVGGATDADYRPEIAVAAGGRRDLGRSVTGTIDASAARYPSGRVIGVHPGLAVDLADGKAQLSARWINVWDETGQYRNGYGVQARWQATGAIALRLGHADAPESSDGVTVDVRAWSAGVDIGLTDRLTLGLGYVSEDRGSYDREELSAGLGWRF